MNKTMKRIASTVVAGAMALIPAGAAFAQTTAVPLTSNNYYVVGGGAGGWGGGCVNSGNLGQLFVLGTLFRGQFGNGVFTPYGTTLGDLLIANQIFNTCY